MVAVGATSLRGLGVVAPLVRPRVLASATLELGGGCLGLTVEVRPGLQRNDPAVLLRVCRGKVIGGPVDQHFVDDRVAFLRRAEGHVAFVQHGPYFRVYSVEESTSVGCEHSDCARLLARGASNAVGRVARPCVAPAGGGNQCAQRLGAGHNKRRVARPIRSRPVAPALADG